MFFRNGKQAAGHLLVNSKGAVKVLDTVPHVDTELL